MRALSALLLMLALPASGAAEVPDLTAPPGTENGRYSMTPAPNGFLRLDTRTGAVSLCTVSGASAECRAAADDRAALTAEIERLVKRNAELEARLAQSDRPKSLPDAGDMNRALDYAEQFMRRMMRIMRDESKNPT